MFDNLRSQHTMGSEPTGEEGQPADNEPPESSRYEVLVANEQSSLSIDNTLLQHAVRDVLQRSPYQSAMISVVVVDDPTIHQLNRQFLEHDYPTDVLSFELDSTDNHVEGELVISADTATTNAADYGWSPFSELLLYAVHGTLHLVGYRDKSADEAAAMREAEARCLESVGLIVPPKHFSPEE